MAHPLDSTFYETIKSNKRSIIENSLFRQTRQCLNLRYPFKKTKERMQIHVIFTMSIFALINAYRKWTEKQYSILIFSSSEISATTTTFILRPISYSEASFALREIRLSFIVRTKSVLLPVSTSDFLADSPPNQEQPG